jgi:hypothetical protein
MKTVFLVVREERDTLSNATFYDTISIHRDKDNASRRASAWKFYNTDPLVNYRISEREVED